MPKSNQQHRHNLSRLLAVGAVIAIVLPSIGCGDSLPMVKVRGIVKFDGGECPLDGRIVFKPMEVPEGLPDRAGTAQFQKDGKFAVTSYKTGDGLLPGRYKVEITCISGIPNFADPKGMDKVSFIAPGYEPPELIVEKGKPVDITYDVPAKK